MTTHDISILDKLFSNHRFTCQVEPVTVTPEELVHVFGTQEPVRDQPDDRARTLLKLNWLNISHIRPGLTESEQLNLVSSLQQSARTWLKAPAEAVSSEDREQVRWIIEKTRSYESKQQISQRVWQAVVLYNLGCRDLRFDGEGQILWDGGITGRIGIAPDLVLDLIWSQGSHESYAASFRQPDGTITRGKGRRRWHVYRLTLDPAADKLFTRRAQLQKEKIALIVASEIFATQPQLPRDFYGGDEFQQACIDAQDQSFNHILVLSPQHGVISLDEVVPSEQSWGEIMERRIWQWQTQALQRLGMYLFGEPRFKGPEFQDMDWWPWLSPESRYEFTVFGGGFPVRILLDFVIRARAQAPNNRATVILAERRPGYNVDDFEDDVLDEEGEYYDSDADFEAVLQDMDQLLEWSAELVSLVNIYVPPTNETWELAPDEVLIPIRALVDADVDIENFLDVLTDLQLLLDREVPLSALISANMVVSILLQITHSLVHNDQDSIQELLNLLPEAALQQYIENALQEVNQEDQLCACLTLAEQMQLVALNLPSAMSDQLLIWLQTYISARMRHRLLGDTDTERSSR